MKTKFAFCKLLSLLLVICLVCSALFGCDMIASKHLEGRYDDNGNENIDNWNDNQENWDNSNNINTWDDIEIYEYADAVYSQLLFEDILDEAPVIDCVILDYKNNGVYFDGELVYSMVNDKFDVNSFVAKYAIGTGVIAISAILTYSAIGTPVFCFIAGAYDASVKMAIKGAAFGAAIKAVTVALKAGNGEEILYGALEGLTDGYMWGAIYGAATGGFSSKYCFTGDTLVQTENGCQAIATLNIGDRVLSFNEKSGSFEYKPITQISKNYTKQTVIISSNDEAIESTLSHPYLTEYGWKVAGLLQRGDRLKTNIGNLTVTDIECRNYENAIETYTLCVEENHNFIVGENGLIAHNKCNINSEYANSRKHFPEGTPQAQKYPNGVLFSKDSNGKVWARFEEYAELINGQPAIVKFEPGVLKGNCLTSANGDFGMTLKALGLKKMPPGCTIHHVEDGQTMILIKQEIHSVAFGGMAHTGGESVIKAMLAVATP